MPIDRSHIATGATLTESDGSIVPVIWRSFDDDAEQLPVYPAAVMRLIDTD